MVKRPPSSQVKSVFSLTSKFNNILEQVVAGDHQSHIMNIKIDHNTNFDRMGNITPMGFIAYWHAVDFTMKEFDRGKTELMPVAACQKSLQHDQSSQCTHHTYGSSSHSSSHHHRSQDKYKRHSPQYQHRK